MIEESDATSTRPYLIRALYEWCTDNGLTPHLAVLVGQGVQVPREFVKDGEIVLNVSFDATSGLKLGNEFVEFKARFAGTPRDIVVPVQQVMAIYARETGQGMSFPTRAAVESDGPRTSLQNDGTRSRRAKGERKPLSSVEVMTADDESHPKPDQPQGPSKGTRPTLTRIK